MGRAKIKGVFSSQTELVVGTGTTRRQSIQKTFWYVEEQLNGVLEVQPLNSNNVPSGPKLNVERDKFLSTYHPEPEHYTDVVQPSMNELEKTVKRGEKHRANSERYSAEYEFNHAVDVDEENVRANFGLGLTYLERGEVGRAEDIFNRLANIDATYEPQHKHLFNDFGISMRKNGMIDQAIAFYHKAEEICKEDEHLFLNIARAYYEKGDCTSCLKYLQKALEVNPELEEAAMFWAYLKSNGYIEDDEDLAFNIEIKPRSKEKKGPVEGLEIDF